MKYRNFGICKFTGVIEESIPLTIRVDVVWNASEKCIQESIFLLLDNNTIMTNKLEFKK